MTNKIQVKECFPSSSITGGKKHGQNNFNNMLIELLNNLEKNKTKKYTHKKKQKTKSSQEEWIFFCILQILKWAGNIKKNFFSHAETEQNS